MSTRRQIPVLSLRLLTCGLAILTITGATSIAAAQPVTAVVPFEGRGSATARRAVVSAIEGDATLIDDDRAEAAAGAHGTSGAEAGDVVSLAMELQAQLIVGGSVSGSARAPRIRLVIWGADGSELARGTAVYGQNRRRRLAFQRSISRLFSRAASNAPAIPRPAAPEPPPPTFDEPMIREPEPERDEDEAVPDDGLPVLVIHALLTIRNREVDVNVPGDDPRRYEMPGFAELGLGLELRPFANTGGLLRGIYATAEFAHSLGLSSRVEGGDEGLSTNFLRVFGQAGWLAPLDRAVELGLGFGVGYDGYHLADNNVLPTAEYLYLRPALRGRFRAVDEALVIEAELAYRGVVDAGPLVPPLGAGVEVHGFDFGLGISGTLAPLMEDIGFFWGVRFDWVGYWLGFDGAGTDVEAESGTESSWRITLRAGWAF